MFTYRRLSKRCQGEQHNCLNHEQTSEWLLMTHITLRLKVIRKSDIVRVGKAEITNLLAVDEACKAVF